MTNQLDLHMHSNVSNDGELTPAELMQLCRQHGLHTVALTDHNSVRGIAEAQEAANELGLEFICAVELDCRYEDVNLHVLGYGIDPQGAGIDCIERDILKQEQDASPKLMQLIKNMGIHFENERVWELSVDCVVTGEMIVEVALEDERNHNNPLLAPYRENGERSDNPYVNFYWDYCSQGKPAAIPFHYIGLCDAIRLIKNAGGISVLAHPGINIGLNPKKLEGIISCGIDGIEVYSSYHDNKMNAFFSDQTEKHQLLKTMGSDFHGKIKPAIRLGSMNCPEEKDIYQNIMKKI